MRVWRLGLKERRLRFRVPGAGFWVLGVRLRVQGSGFRAQGAGGRAWGYKRAASQKGSVSGCVVQGERCRV